MFHSDKTWFCSGLSTDAAKKISDDLKEAIANKNHQAATQLFDKVKKYMRLRVQENYIKPVEMIRANMASSAVPENIAFIIMGINCILIELLFEIKHGIDESKATIPDGKNTIHFNVSHAYKEILPLLDSNITEELATIFYQGIRCGIIHQGQTKKHTALTCDKYFTQVIEPNGEYYLSNPHTVFEKLKEVYAQYWIEISSKNYNHADSEKLIQKYKHILKHIQ